MKNLLLAAICLLSHYLPAQRFIRVPSGPAFGIQGSSIVPGINGSVSVADVDGDDDMDVLLTGSSAAIGETELYINDGNGIFWNVEEPPFEQIFQGTSAFADVNGDDHPDILIAGRIDSGEGIAKLYLNDGNGGFSEMANTPFTGVVSSSILFIDVNGDEALDVFISGFPDQLNENVIKLYTNDGEGNFTEATTPAFNDFSFQKSFLAKGDVNGDQIEDVLIMGFGTEGVLSKLYINDNDGSFTEVTNSPLAGVTEGAAAFADVNGDEAMDVIITGQISGEGTAKLYLNDGSGAFTEVENSPFQGIIRGTVGFGDIDRDGDPDLFLTGKVLGSADLIAKLYENTGEGNFTESVNPLLLGADNSHAAFADVDGNNGQDLIITGRFNQGDGINARLYLNNGWGRLDPPKTIALKGFGSVDVADVNADGFEDLFLSGPGSSNPSTLHLNDGKGNFNPVEEGPFINIRNGDIAFADIDKDEDPDLVIAGRETQNNLPLTEVYRNEDGGNFVRAATLSGVYFSSIDLADINGDEAHDLLLTGVASGIPRPILYRNNGSGIFIREQETPFETPLIRTSVAFADVDDDGDPDLVMTGLRGSSGGGPEVEYFTNEGDGEFNKVNNPNLEPLYDSAIAFGDVNNDGTPDLLLTGTDDSEMPTTRLYTNDGEGNFTEVPNTPFAGIAFGAVAFGDVDNDGDLDLLISGSTSIPEPFQYEDPITKLYINQGQGNFVEETESMFLPGQGGGIAFSDIDNDGDQDVIITSSPPFGRSDVYINQTVQPVSNEPSITWKGLEFTVYPNPTDDQQVNIQTERLQAGQLQVDVLDLSGRVIQQQHVWVKVGSNEVPVSIGEHLPAGIYLIKITDGERGGVSRLVVTSP